MKMQDWQLSRRALLAKLGVGAACLPLLRAHRAWGAVAPPKRLIVIEMTQGLRQNSWRPATGPLANQALPYTSAAFEGLKREMIFLPDLANPGVVTSGRGAFGVMFYGQGATGAGEYKEPAGKTFDQVVASALPAAPGGRLSLNLGVQIDRSPRATDAPGGNRCFWAGAGQPIDPMTDPFAVHQLLFGGAATPDPAAVRRLLLRRKSILDTVGGSLEELGARLGTEDRRTIEAHFEAIRGLEQRLSAIKTSPATCGVSPTRLNLDDGASYPAILQAQIALMVAALKCGVTQVVTLQTSDAAGSNVDVGSFLPGLPATGARRTWEELAKSPIANGSDFKRLVERWFFESFAGLLRQLESSPEGAGTLLDNTIVVIGNDMQEGESIDAQNVPWMLAGGGDSLATGNCLPSAGQSIGSVMAGICAAMGVPHPYGGAMLGLLRA